MDIFKLSKSLDELIFDVMMWVIFYPYTLARIIFTPDKAIQYVAEEMSDPNDRFPFDNGISPPLFLFLSIVLGWAISIDVPAADLAESNSNFAKLVADSGWNELLFSMALYCIFPLTAAVLCEWRTPGGITRETFRLPFYQQAYLCGPFALISYTALLFASASRDGMTILFYFAFVLGALAWFLFVQTIFFRRSIARNYLTAFGWALLSLTLGLVLFFTIAMVLN